MVGAPRQFSGHLELRPQQTVVRHGEVDGSCQVAAKRANNLAQLVHRSVEVAVRERRGLCCALVLRDSSSNVAFLRCLVPRRTTQGDLELRRQGQLWGD